MDPEPYPLPPSVSHNGFLFKTASMARPVTERKAKEGKHTLQQQHLPQEERIVKVIITIMLGKYLFVYQYRVQSSLVHAK